MIWKTRGDNNSTYTQTYRDGSWMKNKEMSKEKMRVTIRQMASETFNSSNRLQGSFREKLCRVDEKNVTIEERKELLWYMWIKKSINLMIQLSMSTPFVGGISIRSSEGKLFFVRLPSFRYFFFTVQQSYSRVLQRKLCSRRVKKDWNLLNTFSIFDRKDVSIKYALDSRHKLRVKSQE